MIHSINRPTVAAFCLAIGPVSTWACATCGCTVNSDAAMGYAATTGWRVNLEYTYIDQDQLRIGTRTATPAADFGAPFPNPSTSPTLQRVIELLRGRSRRGLGRVGLVAVREERISCPILQPFRTLREFLETEDRYVWGVIVARPWTKRNRNRTQRNGSHSGGLR